MYIYIYRYIYVYIFFFFLLLNIFSEYEDGVRKLIVKLETSNLAKSKFAKIIARI